jgi:hypothetical protein
MATRFRDALPQVRGTYADNAPLKDLVWFRTAGPAEVLFRPADADDLSVFLANKPDGLPVTVIGVGSNLLVRDGGIPGVVIRLPATFGRVSTDGLRIRAGAAALDAAVARAAADAGIAELEFLRGVPGTIGGALRRSKTSSSRRRPSMRKAARSYSNPMTWASSIVKRMCRTNLCSSKPCLQGHRTVLLPFATG